MTDSYDNEELTPRELRQLIASNARAIEALGATVTQTSEAVTRLANLMAQFFQAQANTNIVLDGGLETHETRLRAIEQQLGIDSGDANG